MMKKLTALLLALLLTFSLVSCSESSSSAPQQEKPATEETVAPESAAPESAAPDATAPESAAPEETQEEPAIPEDGSYTSAEDVALYIYTYGHLPDNYITKKEARKLGWEKGGLEPYAPGKSIGGDRFGNYFGNYEGLLPEADGREYTECDIDTLGAKSRGAKRIVFSNDGLIFYTSDHYESFVLMYGEE